MNQFGRAFEKVTLLIGEHGADVHRGSHDRVCQLVRKNAVVEEGRIAAARRVDRSEVFHVDPQDDVRRRTAATDRELHVCEHTCATVAEGRERDTEHVALGLDAVVLLDDTFGLAEPARLQAVEHSKLLRIADHALATLAEHALPVEAGRPPDAVDLIHELFDFLLQGGSIRSAVAGVGRLHCQLANALQVPGHLCERTIRYLEHGDAVVGIAHRLIQATDLRGESFGNGQAAASSAALLMRNPDDSRCNALPNVP